MLATLSSLQWEHLDKSSQSLVDLRMEGLLETEQVVDEDREESLDFWFPPTELDSKTSASSVAEMSRYVETLASPLKRIGDCS